MKKINVWLLVFVFIFTSISVARAADTVRKKVVKIKPAQIEESATPVKTTRIRPSALEESNAAGTGKKPPKAGSIAGGAGSEGMGAAEKGPSGLFVAIKGGFALPRYLAGGEIGTTLVANVMDKTDLAGRLGVGYRGGFDYKAWDISGDVFLSWDVFRSASLPLTLNLGAGINYPVSVNDNRTGNLGFNVFLGLNYDIFEKGQLFVETGFHTFAIKDQDTRNGVSALIGYKQFI